MNSLYFPKGLEAIRVQVIKFLIKISMLSILVSFMPASLSAGVSVPYTSDIGSNYSLCPGWQNVKRSDNYWTYDRSSDFSTPGTLGGMVHTWEPKASADAMLISPPIELVEGTSYTVSFWVKTTDNTLNEHEAFKLFMGSSGTLSALKDAITLIDVSDYCHNDDFELLSATFIASASGDTYFGIHCCSDSWQGNLCVTGFSICVTNQAIFYIDVDNASRISVVDNWYDKETYLPKSNLIQLVNGLNALSIDDNSHALKITAVDGYFLTGCIRQSTGEANCISDNTSTIISVDPYSNVAGDTFVVTTKSVTESRSASVTVNIDEPEIVNMFRNHVKGSFTFTEPSTVITYNPNEELPLMFCTTDSQKKIYKIKVSEGDTWESENTWGVTPVDGAVIDIITLEEGMSTYEVMVGTPAYTDEGVLSTTMKGIFNFYDKNSTGVVLYTAADLGLHGGEKITQIKFRGRVNGDITEDYAMFFEFTDDTEQSQPAPGEYDVTGMIRLLDWPAHQWTVAGSESEPVDVIVVNLVTPIVYEAGKSIRIVARGTSDKYVRTHLVASTNTANNWGHSNDNRSAYENQEWKSDKLPLMYLVIKDDSIAPDVLHVPFELKPTAKDIETFTILDLNEDAGDYDEWKYQTNFDGLVSPSSSTHAEDDWAFTPAINFSDNSKYYSLTFDAYTNMPFPQCGTVEIYVSSENSPDAIRLKIGELKNFASPEREQRVPFNMPFRIPSAGHYYIGFHCVTSPDDAVEPWPVVFQNIGVCKTETMTIGKTETRAGASVEIPFAIANSSSLLGFQADIYLGDGASFRQNGDEYEVTLTSERTTARHLVKSSLLADGALRVMALSIDNTPFVGNEGDIFKLKIDIAPDATDPIAINVRNIRLSEKTDNKISEVTLNDCAGEISLKSYRLGDMDDNGSLSINDVTNLIELVLDNMPDGIIPQAGDLDGNGVYSVNDVTLLTDYVLRGEWPVETRLAASTMSVSATVEVQGDELVMPLSFGNAGDITAFQADIRLPDGMAVRELAVDNANAGFSCRFREIEPGTVRVVGYSPSLTTLKGETPISLILEVNPGCRGGEVVLSAMQAVSSDFVELDAAPLRLDISQSALASIAGHGVDVRTVGQTVVVSAPIGSRVTIHDVLGRVVAAGQLSDSTESFTLASTGIYMVSVDNKVFKTILR